MAGQIQIPKEVAQLAAAVIEIWNEGEMDIDDLERAIALAIVAGRGLIDPNSIYEKELARMERTAATTKAYKRNQRIADPIAHRERRLARYQEIMADPEKRAKQQEYYRQRNRRRRQEDPEKFRERDRLKDARRRAADPEKVRLAQKASVKRRKERDPEAWRRLETRKSRRRAMRKGTRMADAQALAQSVVPRTYPQHVRDDIVSAVMVVVMDGRILPKEIPSECKRQTTAYWRERPEYRLKSLDAQAFDDGKATLHDKISAT